MSKGKLLFLTLCKGVLGSWLIRLNVEFAIYRRQSVINDWPVLEVVTASAITAALSFIVSPAVHISWLCWPLTHPLVGGLRSVSRSSQQKYGC
jgi:hypothetical protein